MTDYKTLYFSLLANVFDALENLSAAVQQAEEAYIQDDAPAMQLCRKEGSVPPASAIRGENRKE